MHSCMLNPLDCLRVFRGDCPIPTKQGAIEIEREELEPIHKNQASTPKKRLWQAHWLFRGYP